MGAAKERHGVCRSVCEPQESARDAQNCPLIMTPTVSLSVAARLLSFDFCWSMPDEISRR
jgi:hypothetical protein